MFGFGGKSTPEPAPEPAYSVDLGSESSISHSTSSSNFMESSSSASEDAELQVSKVVSYINDFHLLIVIVHRDILWENNNGHSSKSK